MQQLPAAFLQAFHDGDDGLVVRHRDPQRLRLPTAMGSDSISRTLRRPSRGKRRGAPARKRFDLGPKSIATQSPGLVGRLPDGIDVGPGWLPPE